MLEEQQGVRPVGLVRRLCSEQLKNLNTNSNEVTNGSFTSSKETQNRDRPTEE